VCPERCEGGQCFPALVEGLSSGCGATQHELLPASTASTALLKLGRWGDEFHRTLLRLRMQRAPPF